jgi:hypothetical protein
VIAIIPKTNFKKALRRHKKLLKRLSKRKSQYVSAAEQLVSPEMDDEAEIEVFGLSMNGFPFPQRLKRRMNCLW